MIPPVISWGDVDRLAADRHVVIADVRWYLDGRSGRAAYEAGHVPCAAFVDLDTALAGHDRPATEGRHPLPSPDEFAASMGALGIGDDATVVAYDDSGGGTAGRLVVMLRMLDRDAALADGGLAAWSGDVQHGPTPEVDRVTFTRQPWPEARLADHDDVVATVAAGGVAIDARSAERFTGEVTAIDRRPGHIPGATSAPWTAMLDPDTGRLRSSDELRAHFAAVGIDDATDVVASCGSGVSACANVLAMERAGLAPPRLYVASFSGWSTDPDRDVELGPGR